MARHNLKFMAKRGSDADSRIFFDEFVSVAASRLKATGAIRLEDRHGIIALPQARIGGFAARALSTVKSNPSR